MGGLVFALVNLPFVFLFYDSFNLNDTIYGSSLLFLGITPYNPALGSTVIVGYPFLSLNQSLFGSYLLTHFSVLGAAALEKVVLLAATYFAALILLKILEIERFPSWKTLYYTFLLNPFLLFVNDVWMESDAIVLLGILGAIYLFRYEWELRGNPLGIYGGALALVAVGFAYFTPLFLVPSFVVFGQRRRSWLYTLLALAVGAAIYAVPMLTSPLDPLAVRSLGTVSAFNPYSLTNLFTAKNVSPGTDVLLALLGTAALLALVIPVLCRRRGIPFEVAALAVLSVALVLTVAYFEPDNFVLLTGLVPLAIVAARPSKVNVLRVFALESVLLPVLWVVNMWNGPGQVSGVFYWAYFWVGRDIDLYPVLGGLWVWKTCLALIPILALGSAVYLARAARRRVPEATPVHTPTSSPPERPRGSRSSLSGVLTWGVAALILLVPLVGVALPAQSAEISTVGEFPSQFFVVHDLDSPSVYLMPAASTYAVNSAAGSVTVSAGAPAMEFIRYLGGQDFNFSVVASLPSAAELPLGTTLDVANASGSLVGFARGVSLLDTASPLAPIDRSNVTASAQPNLVLSNVSTVYLTNGSGLSTFAAGSTDLRGSTVYFGARLSQYASSQSLLWDLTVNGTVELEAYILPGVFVVGEWVDGSWTAYRAPISSGLGAWLLAGVAIDENGDSVTISLGPTQVTLPFEWPVGPDAYLYVGKFGPDPAYDGRVAVIGELTDVYSVPDQVISSFVAPYAELSGSVLLPEVYATTVSIQYSGGQSVDRLHFANTTVTLPSSAAPTFSVGKLTDSPTAVRFQFLSIELRTTRVSPWLLWTVVEFGLAAPLTAVWFYYRTRRVASRVAPTPG